MNIKIKSRLISAVWVAYVIFSFLYYPKLVAMMATTGLLVGMGVYLLTNPHYLLLMYYIIWQDKKSKFKAVIASILIVFSLDVVASPRVQVEEIFTTGSATIMNLGTIVIKAMVEMGFNLRLAHYSYYIIFPIICFLLSLEILGIIDFIKKMGNGGV